MEQLYRTAAPWFCSCKIKTHHQYKRYVKKRNVNILIVSASLLWCNHWSYVKSFLNQIPWTNKIFSFIVERIAKGRFINNFLSSLYFHSNTGSFSHINTKFEFTFPLLFFISYIYFINIIASSYICIDYFIGRNAFFYILWWHDTLYLPYYCYYPAHLMVSKYLDFYYCSASDD